MTLPIYQLNDSSLLHETSINKINSLPSEDLFPFDFDDLAVQQVQSYTIIQVKVFLPSMH